MFLLEQKNDLIFLKSDILRSVHGFSTRTGGVSTLPHTASLNLAFGRGDDDGTVLTNLRRFAAAVGFSWGKLISVPQIHSTDVRVVGEDDAGRGVSRPADASFDGYVTCTPDLPIGVKTADCVPILLEARRGEDVCGVAAVHAGWRGTVGGIAALAVLKLRELTDGEIFAAIGPAIGACCYEVREDFCEAVAAARGADFAARHIRRVGERDLADLRGMNEELLRGAGLPPSHIDVCTFCTSCRDDLFYSHRHSHGVRGTMMSIITM